MTEALKAHFIPSKDGSNKNVLVLVHGRTGNIRVLEWFSKRLAIDSLSFITVQAPFSDKRTDQTDEGFSWYLKNRSGIDQSRELLRSFIDSIKERGFASEQIYWLGFSQGCAMILDIALRSKEKFGGFVGVSGLCVQAEAYPQALSQVALQQRIWISHGNRDEIVTLEEAESTYDVLRRAGVPFDFKVYDKPHSFKLNEEIPDIESLLKSWMSL